MHFICIDWRHLRELAEEDQAYVIESPFGSRIHRRRAGDVLHPECEPLATLEALRRGLGPYNFAGQYQQAPRPPAVAWWRPLGSRVTRLRICRKN